MARDLIRCVRYSTARVWPTERVSFACLSRPHSRVMHIANVVRPGAQLPDRCLIIMLVSITA